MNLPPGLPGGPAMQPQVQPARTEYPSIELDVQVQQDGTRVLVVHSLLPNQILIFPMPVAVAEQIGAKLSAPSVVLPNGNGHH